MAAKYQLEGQKINLSHGELVNPTRRSIFGTFFPPLFIFSKVISSQRMLILGATDIRDESSQALGLPPRNGAVVVNYSRLGDFVSRSGLEPQSKLSLVFSADRAVD